MKSVEQVLRGLEEDMRRPENRVPEAMSRMLAPEFVEFGSSGRALTKSECLAVVQAQTPFPMTTSNFKVLMLSDTVGLVTYRVTRHSLPRLHTLRSSIWQKRDDDWLLVFHQGTVVPD